MRTDADKKLLWFAGSLAGCLLFMTVHSFIYNWVFLPRLFAGKEMPFIINTYIIAQYWKWPVGKILILTNVFLLLLPFLILKWAFMRHRC